MGVNGGGPTPIKELSYPIMACQIIFCGQTNNKLGLYWAKLSSSWDWTLLHLICIKLMNKTNYCQLTLQQY